MKNIKKMEVQTMTGSDHMTLRYEEERKEVEEIKQEKKNNKL